MMKLNPVVGVNTQHFSDHLSACIFIILIIGIDIPTFLSNKGNCDSQHARHTHMIIMIKIIRSNIESMLEIN